MSCAERGCIMPATKTGYCQSHAWRAPNAPTIDGFATGMRSSIDGRVARTHQSVPVPKDSFSPRITIEESTLNPGKHVWMWHLPDGKTHNYGVVGVVSMAVTVNEYVKKLGKDYRRLLDPSDVSVDEPPAETTVPTVAPFRAGKAQELLAGPQEKRAYTVGAGWEEKVFDAVKAGARTTGEVCAAVPGMGSSTASAWLGQMTKRNRLEVYGVEGRSNLYRVPGDKPVEAAPVEKAPVEHDGQFAKSSKPPDMIEAAAPAKAEPTINERTAVIAKVMAGKIEATASPSPLPQDGDYCERLLSAAVQYAAGFAAGGEADAAVSRVLGELAIEAWIYREAKKITDGALSQPDSDPVPEWAWKAMHAAVMPLLSSRFEDRP